MDKHTRGTPSKLETAWIGTENRTTRGMVATARGRLGLAVVASADERHTTGGIGQYFPAERDCGQRDESRGKGLDA